MESNKSLVVKENLNIFQKIKRFLKNIFKKDKNYIINENLEIPEAENIKINEEESISEIQNKYESGKIKLNDLTQEEKERLYNLYMEQIQKLKEEEKTYQKELDYYKGKILSERAKKR